MKNVKKLLRFKKTKYVETHIKFTSYPKLFGHVYFDWRIFRKRTTAKIIKNRTENVWYKIYTKLT